MNPRALALSASLVATLAGTALGQFCPTWVKRDNGVSAAIDDNFAAAVSMSFGGLNNCPLVAVGHPNEDAPVSGDNAGGFTVYQKPFGNWIVMYDSWNTTGQGGERLGASISLADPYIILGAPGFNGGDGRARVMRRPSNGSGYTGPVDLTPGLGWIGSGFGRAVAISAYGGGWAVVGAPTHDFHGEVDAGAAFFYTRDDANNSWNLDYQIWGGDFGGNTLDHRGTAVAMAQYSEFAAIGSPDREVTGQPANHGAVRIVHRLANGFVSGQSQEVRPPSPEQDEHFGAAVAIEHDLLVVGAPDEDMTLQEGGFFQQATNGGAIYIFVRNAQTSDWEFVTKLRSPVPTSDGHFGAQVATDGGARIVVSEPGSKHVYLFSSAGGAWHYQATVSDPDNPAGGAFGSAVAIRGEDVAIGDPMDDNNTMNNAGAVYMMELDAAVATGDLCSDPLPIPSGDFVGCTDLATPSRGEPTTCGNGGDGQGNDVWFAFTPDCSGNAIFDTFGSDFDTVLSVHSSCPSLLSGNSIVCNDDASFPAPNNRASLVTFNFVAGETYLVRIAGYNQTSGQFTLRHLYTFSAPNDSCGGAIQIDSGSTPFNTCAATTNNNLTSTCGGGQDLIYKDLWYRWTAPQSAPTRLNTCGSTFDTILAVYQQSCPANGAAQIACNDDSANVCTPGGTTTDSAVTFVATAGQTYFIRVGGYHNDGGAGTLNLEQVPCAADFNHDGYTNSQDFFDFLNAFFALAPAADFNGDGPINSQDYFDFLTAFFAGC